MRSQVVAPETQQPVANAFIFPRDLNTSTVTDEEGYLELLLPDSLAEKQIRIHILHNNIGINNTSATLAEFPTVIELSAFKPGKTISGGGLVVVKRKWRQRRRKDCK